MKQVQKVAMICVVAAALASLVGCATTIPEADRLTTVDALDLDRYLGSWYEIARYQHGFEKNLVGAKADYSLRDDGRIQVVNSGLKKTLDGKLTSVKAVAWRPDEAQPGRLKVKFFGLFTSDYLVFGLDEQQYQWALVGNDSKDYLWFLSRTPVVSDELLSTMKQLAREQGYDLENLFLVPQKER